MAIPTHSPTTPTPSSLPPLHLLVCGSVDDGKSTLIGRMLLDADAVHDDQLQQVRQASERYGTTGTDIDPALLTDGLQAEREQGITIDIAWRYFTTPTRRIVIIDSPGHEQYTLNMATGASHANAAVLLIDARKGLLPQTRRHATICALMGIRNIVLAINKMDLVNYDENTYLRIVQKFNQAAKQIGFSNVTPIPLASRDGDMIIHRGANLHWYEGPTLIELLHQDLDKLTDNAQPLRLPVQMVIRPHLDFRGFAGRIKSGSVRVGDTIQVNPSGARSRVKEILLGEEPIEHASTGTSITLTLEDEIDIIRGDVLSHPENTTITSRRFEVDLVWMSDQPLAPNQSVLLRSGTHTTPARINQIIDQLDVQTLERHITQDIQRNSITRVVLETVRPLALDPYDTQTSLGALVLIDRIRHETLAAGMVRNITPLDQANNHDTLQNTKANPVSTDLRHSLRGHTGAHLHFEGPGSIALRDALHLELLHHNTFANTCEPELGRALAQHGAVALSHSHADHTALQITLHTESGQSSQTSLPPASTIPHALQTLTQYLRRQGIIDIHLLLQQQGGGI